MFFCLSFKPFEATNKKELIYKVLAGENQQSSKLIILLHGMNSNTEMWEKFSKSVDEKTLLVAVEAPMMTKLNSYRWFNIDISKKPFISDIN